MLVDPGTVLIPNRTFLVRFGGISGEFGRAMVRILARRSRVKIPMVRPDEPDSDQSGVLVIWRVSREKNSASILFSNSSSVIFIILLFGVSFSESWRPKLRELFGKCGSILKEKSFSAVRKHTRERPPVWCRSILARNCIFLSLLASNKLLSSLTIVIFLSFVVCLL